MTADSDPPDWFLNRQRSVPFDQEEIVRFAAGLRRKLAGGREFAVCIASDDTVRRANRQFRNRRATTDVLSFPDDEVSGWATSSFRPLARASRPNAWATPSKTSSRSSCFTACSTSLATTTNRIRARCAASNEHGAAASTSPPD